MRAALIFPHQLFQDHPALRGADLAVLVEDPLIFRELRFHAAKLVLHRASMQSYAEELRSAGVRVEYLRSSELRTVEDLVARLGQLAVRTVQYVDPSDDWLDRRLVRTLNRHQIAWTRLDDPHFLTTDEMFQRFALGKKKFFFTEFYVAQRKRHQILLEADERPRGGQWSFDTSNRRKLPKGIQLPAVYEAPGNRFTKAAEKEIAVEFPNAVGAGSRSLYPINREQALAALHDFLEHRFELFGDYEDAIHKDESVLFHSVLTPMLNIGLLSPREVVDAALEYEDRVPLNSLEGFVRQVIGWREYIRGVYRVWGRRQRTTNFWEHDRQIPRSFYDAATGIEPIDCVIRRVRKTGYCHHIERLMILGNFMLLCEFHPDEVYRWFMEHFVDAYDWVMVPNIYGMSQHADGGLMTTKPYLSGSAYVLKMSNFRRGAWCEVWDALYWRFIHQHRSFFSANPRMSVMVSQLDRMGAKLSKHLQIADDFLGKL